MDSAVVRRRPGLLGLTSLLVLAGALSPNLSLRGQQPPGARDEAFLTASVTPVRSTWSFGGKRARPQTGPVFTNDQMTIRGVTLWDLIRHVYTRPSPHYFDGRPTPYRVEGGAKWVETDRFDIDATMPPGASKDSYRAMLRTLLRDRFKLDAAIVAKDMPASLLVVRDAAKGLGPRLRRSTSECSSVNIVMVAPGQRGMARACELVLESQLAGGTFAVHGRGAGLGLLARYLSQQHGLVVDQTQLTGVFDFDFECCASWMEEPYTVPLSVYLEEQLGLTLRSTKAPEEVVVIRKAERPR